MQRLTLFKVYELIRNDRSHFGDREDSDFRRFLSIEFEGTRIELSDQVKNGVISFPLLPYLFNPQETVILECGYTEALYGSTFRYGTERYIKDRTVVDIDVDTGLYAARPPEVAIGSECSVS